jgi:hypothetical protein
MARYDWPGPRDPERRDRARFRAEALFERLADVPGVILSEASALRSSLLGALLGDADANVWLPIGPSVVIEGQAGSAPRVNGRVRDIAVSDDGQRVYAATANGGVWYSGDAGANWSPLGSGASTPVGEALAPGPNSLATSCLLVTFGSNADGSQDQVYAGTGEIRPYSHGYPGGKAAGIGVLKLIRPLPDALAHAEINPWQREAGNLSGMGIFRLARNPGPTENALIAATSTGLWKRTGAFVEGNNWTRVTQGPFDFDADDDKWCTDVWWEPAKGPTPSRLWVALIDDTLFTDTGIWVSEAGVDGPYEKVDLDGASRSGRLGISVHKKDPSIAYVLGRGPRLWRIDTKRARRVRKLPNHLFGDDNDQSAYDLAVAAHPEKPDEVIVGGSAVLAEQTMGTVDGKPKLVGGDWSASLFRLTITGTAAADDYACNFDTTKQDAPGTDANTFIGSNVHSDVHIVRYTGVPAGQHVWVGCDGGVYQSTQKGDSYSFIPRNNGLSVIEAGYVASHPTADGAVIIGTQDNGALRRIGDTIWSLWVYGDGGGVAYHPTVPRHYVGQYTQGDWNSTSGRWVPPVERDKCSKESIKTENNASAFYSDLDIIAGVGQKARVALGTNRLWISEDWDPTSGAANMTWQTLPSGSDPRLNGKNNTGQDAIDSEYGSVRVVLWAGPPGHREDRILVMCRRAILSYVRDAGTGKWAKPHVISRYNEKCGDDEMDNDEIGETTSSVMPAIGAWSDVAIHDPARGAHGSFYVSATGYATFDDETLKDAGRMDTLWWFDGAGTWHPTRLRGNVSATRAPAFAVAVDPDDIGIVYAGTSAGVWKGQLTFNGAQPAWAWEIFSNGLPDAYVQDLSFFKHGDLKLLRAAMQARGVWEVDLSVPPSPPRRTYLRAHHFDTRRRFPTVMMDPESRQSPPADFKWYDGPDVRLRPAPGAPPPPRPIGLTGLPWTRTKSGNTYRLWAIQTAMHADDPLVRPTGKWTHQFDARIKAYRAAKSLPNPGTATIDVALWDRAVADNKFFFNPWDSPEPTEADLKELIQEVNFTIAGAFAILAFPVACKVDVLVHHRHFQPVNGADIKVLLLRREIDTATESDGGGVALSAAWKNAVVQRLGGGAQALPDGWEVVGLASPTAPVSAMMPRPVTFDVDFSADPPFTTGTVWVFVAVVSADTDEATTSSLAGDTIEALVRNSHHVAARLFYVFI